MTKNSENFPHPNVETEKTVEKLQQITQEALLRAFQEHQKLGKAGKKEVQKNPFGETALLGDIEAEKAILDFLKEINFPIRVMSEEHGVVNITKNPHYLGALDGLDGTKFYKKGIGRYGTMFGILETIDPKYNQYAVSGIMEHSTGDLYIATRERGAWLINEKENIRTRLKASLCKTLDRNTRICVDNHHKISQELFLPKLADFNTISMDAVSAESYHADISAGRIDLVLECTRKGNLEGVIGFGMETEAGAIVVDLEGNSLGDKKYLEFGQGKNEHLPVIIAATPELANAVIEHLRK